MANLVQLAQMAETAEAELMYAGIFSPDFGQREDIPNIILPDGFTAENTNIFAKNGKLARMKMRLPEFLETAFTTGTITAVNGSDTITASAGAGTWGATADHKPYWTARTITITDDGVDTDYTIDSVNDTGDEITLTANYTGTGGAGLAYSIGTPGTKVVTPDEKAVIHYERLLQESAGIVGEYLLSYTEAHVYLWDQVWSAWMLKFTCDSACTHWSTDIIKNQVISTNNVDLVQIWGSAVSSAFGALSNAAGPDVGAGVRLTKAKYLRVCQNYVLLLGVTVGGIEYVNDVYWSTYYNEADWDQAGTGDCGSTTIEGPGQICGAARYGRDLFIGKTECCKMMRLVSNANIWEIDPLFDNCGLAGPDCIATDKEDRLYFLDNGYNIRRLPDKQIVSQALEATLKEINPSLMRDVRATYISEYDLIWWAIPYGADATGNNIIVQLDPAKLTMGKVAIAVSAFGKYSRQVTYSWATLPYLTWPAWDWDAWNATENVTGFALDLGADYAGNTYTLHGSELDDTSNYEGSLVLSLDALANQISKRYGISLMYFKRIYHFQLWVGNAGTGTISISTKSDNETSWQLRGAGSLAGTTGIFPVDIFIPDSVRARHHLVKIHASNRFTVYGLIFGFRPDGTK